ncbi:MAG: hypothetical protein ACMG51_01915 [Ginsengibacter sp.]
MNNSTLNITLPQKFPEAKDLEKIVEEFPESAYARLLLLYRNNKNITENELNDGGKNFLYFNNNRWIKFLLNDWLSHKRYDDPGHYAISFPESEEQVPTSKSEELIKEVHDQEHFTEPIKEEISKQNHEILEDTLPVLENSESNLTQIESEVDNNHSESTEIPDNSLVFEPLHTTDYFASQGIKVSEEQISDDKLGKQLKSFTDWLKMMKKIHPSKLALQNEGLEQLVQSAAERSNTGEEIVTEAMADVLLQQGKSGKAIELFEKLSLIYPAKSSYFAAKIESLKHY